MNNFKNLNLYSTKINDIFIIDFLIDDCEYKPIMCIQHVTNDKLYIVLTKNIGVPYKHKLTFYVYDDIEQRLNTHQLMRFNIQPTKVDLNNAINIMYNKYIEKYS